MKRWLFSIIAGVVFVAASHQARADEFRKDGTPCLDKRSLLSSPRRKAEIKKWFDTMGIDTGADGFVKDVYHLISGIDERLSPTANFTVSAGVGLKMGVTF